MATMELKAPAANRAPHAATGPGVPPMVPAPRRDLVLLLLLALAVRFAGLPWATADSWDHVARIWAAWRWEEAPFALTWGVWGPLHYMLMAPVVAWFGPETAPTVLHILLGALVPPLLYLFARRELGDRWGALLVGIAAALAPALILNSLSARSETPTAICVLLAMLALSRARAERSVAWAALAGLALTLGGGFRYEPWMLTPFLAAILWPERRLMAAFLVTALIWPAIAGLSNLIVYHDPLWGITFASQHELVGMGTSALSLTARLTRGLTFLMAIVNGLSPLLTILVLVGIATCLRARHAALRWLIPVGGLLALLLAAVLRGSLVPKINYTETPILFLLPFAAMALTPERRTRLGRPTTLAITAVVLAGMASLLVIGTLRRFPEIREHNLIVGKIPAVTPVPIVRGQDQMILLGEAIGTEIGQAPQAGFVIDFLGFVPHGIISLASGIHPDRVYTLQRVPDAPPETRLDQPLRYREMPFIGNDPPDIASFLAHYPEGIIALSPDLPTRTAWLGLEVADGHTYLRRLGLELTELHRVNVPMPDEMRPGGTKSTDRMDIVAYRYRPATLPPPG